ncbi:hypothetical protein ATANTOWER_006737 [Ataeniobius toweri]|uniref:Uncharacterized protein n=1 Tax=Ataeniobius toweri TaxID=208326 RepID=A0ABU7ATL7_9TELE|nr:hypothetical protein [Ataeniobius toweri]
MIKPIYALWISYPISCLRLDSHQAGSFLLPSSPGPSHEVISLATRADNGIRERRRARADRSNYNPQLKSNFPTYAKASPQQPVSEPEPMLVGCTRLSFEERQKRRIKPVVSSDSNSSLSAPSSHRTAPKKPSMDSPLLNLDPESLYPWRPDHSYLTTPAAETRKPQNPPYTSR